MNSQRRQRCAGGRRQQPAARELFFAGGVARAAPGALREGIQLVGEPEGLGQGGPVGARLAPLEGEADEAVPEGVAGRQEERQRQVDLQQPAHAPAQRVPRRQPLDLSRRRRRRRRHRRPLGQ